MMKILRRIKWALYPLRYLRVMWGMRPWDYSYILKMLQFQLKEQDRHRILKGVSEYPDDEKVAVRRSIELIEAILEGAYWVRCGFNHDFEIVWKVDPETGLYIVEGTTETEEQEIKNDKAKRNAYALEEKEWDELWDTIKNNMRNWWD